MDHETMISGRLLRVLPRGHAGGLEPQKIKASFRFD
jgi:hypothetical protein